MHNWTRFLVAVVAVSLFSCGDNAEGPPDASPKPACSDGKDNDHDGKVDFPDDLGCLDEMSNTEESPERPKCSDNRDNDGDGKKDYPNDPGCLQPELDDETDDCPGGPYCPQCSNKADDDLSGATDFPNDPGCASAADNIEYLDNPVACGANMTVKYLPITGMDSGMLDATSTSNLPTSCGGGNGAPAVAYVMVLSKPKVVVISTAGSTADTVLDLRTNPCQDPASSLECNDDFGTGNNTSQITRSLAAGVYYIIVEGYDSGQSGMYQLKVEKFNGEGETCTMQSDCGPGLVCRIPVGGTNMICTQPVCKDGLDDDADGKIDYPNDPGCDTPNDATENDDCPTGPNCPDCSDGADNDGDTFTDYPADTSCKAAADSSEACVTSEPIAVITTATTMGTTVGAVDDYDPTCNLSGATAADLLYRLDLPAMQVLTLNVTGFDTVHTLLDSTCGGTPIACSDPSLMTRNNLPAGTYYLTVEGWNTVNNAFTIQTAGTIAPGGSCEGVLFQNGVITCPTGFVCDGTPGAKTCRTQCSDGVDNNSDGKTDYPSDPGCSAPNDNSEDTVCPGPMCPVCADGMDNDGDTQIDWPLDTSCPAAGGTSESCATSEPIGAITTAVTTGTTIGATNDHDPTCNSSIGLAPDVIYSLDLPAMATLTLNVTGFDTAHTLLDSSCTSSLVCSDPPLMTVPNLAAGRYFVSVEGWSTTTGNFTITTGGQVAPGGSCEGVLFQNGAITCQPGFLCQGPVGARTCRTECTDGIDNNSDGQTDYPNDPGCSSPADNSETTVCPGAMCPVCADGLDNDGDTMIDFPLDPQCLAAGGSSESCITSEPIGIITTQVTTGTTAGLTNDFKPTCGFLTNHTAPDTMYQLDLPNMQSLSLNLTGFDGAHSLLDSQCSAVPVACSDPSLMTVPNVGAGRYYVVVDGWSSGSGAYTLTTTGVIAAGGSCESPLFTAGAFTCATGATCQGPVGAKKCVSQCSDGVDNNADGKIDFPNDPACTSLGDNTENTVCPGVSCPACGNALDDDGDTAIDFPADVGCASAAGTTEVFCAVEPNFAGVIATPTTNGTLAGLANNYNQTCQTNTGNDTVYALSLPVPVQALRVDTIGSTVQDTVVSVKDSACGTQLGCDDDGDPAGNLSLLNLANVAPGNYAIQVDSYNSNGANNGPFKLNVRGTVAPGTACTSPLFGSGVLVCGGGTTCNGSVCQ